MLGLLGAAALVLVTGAPWLLPEAAGGKTLKPPQNVEVIMIDDSFTLKWNWSEHSTTDVFFSAAYKTAEMGDWEELPGCQHVTSTTCDFSSLETNVYSEIQLRIRTEEGSSTSPWHELDAFTPAKIAQIGPPGVHLEAEDKAIVIMLSPPGTEESMWALEHSSFRYNIIVWENSSGLEESITTAYPNYNVYNLSPDTTYCLKVRAELPLLKKIGFYSPVFCINTTVENKLPPPSNIHIHPRDGFFALQWDYPYDKVAFQAQWLYAFLKINPESYEDKWKPIPGCANVQTTQCAFHQNDFPKGIYFIRVQASKGNHTSFWSEEKRFATEKQTVIPPPIISAKSINANSLHVSIGTSKDSGNGSVDSYYSLVYEVVFWENSSHSERKRLEKTDFTIPDLKALMVYCVKARALLKDDKQNRSSTFSNTVCEEIQPGNASKVWLSVGIGTALFSIIAVFCIMKFISECIKYVFCPSNKLPSTIDEYFPEQPLCNLLLSPSEEQMERCFIIENMNSLTTVVESGHSDGDHKRYSSQTSQDSGNYSNEDENNESKTSE